MRHPLGRGWGASSALEATGKVTEAGPTDRADAIDSNRTGLRAPCLGNCPPVNYSDWKCLLICFRTRR